MIGDLRLSVGEMHAAVDVQKLYSKPSTFFSAETNRFFCECLNFYVVFEEHFAVSALCFATITCALVFNTLQLSWLSDVSIQEEIWYE